MNAALGKRVQPETRSTRYYFEYKLLNKAQDLYPDQVDVFYSYRRSPFHYSQFAHRSGVAFVQVLDGSQGFLFLTNRSMGPVRMGAAMKNKENKPAATAEDIQRSLNAFCQDAGLLNGFYDERLALLPQAAELDPPPLML